jgi:hypothetical protein
MVHKRGRWVSVNEFTGYWQPSNSIVGQTLFPEHYDRKQQDKDLENLKVFMKNMGVPFRVRTTRSSDDALGKRWVIIPSKHELTNLQEQIIVDFAKKQTKTFHE